MNQEVPTGRTPLASEITDVLETVRQTALLLLSEFPAVPSSLHIRVGEISIQADWAVGPAAGPPPRRDGTTVPARAQALTDEPADGQRHEYVRAPSVGVFYRAAEPGTEPFVAEGDAVEAGQQVATVEAMKLMIPVHAGMPGQLLKVLKQDGETVEYDEPLLAILPMDG